LAKNLEQKQTKQDRSFGLNKQLAEELGPERGIAAPAEAKKILERLKLQGAS
jgi:hypothetical protein